MASDRKRKGGRVTPKSGTPAGDNDADAGADKPVGQVGRRPSSPLFLVAVAVAWIACGIAAFFLIKPAWRIAVGVVFIGVGLYWLRGALATVARHEERLGGE